MKTPGETTLLVVDDEKMLCDAVAAELVRKGYRVLCAYNGREAFEIVKSRPVDLVVSDVRMPGGDGIELLKNIKSFNPISPRFILMTGFSDISSEEAHRLGADTIIAKPFDRATLTEAVQDALKKA